VVELLDDPARAAAQIARGRAYLEADYSAGVGVERLVAAYRAFGLVS